MALKRARRRSRDFRVLEDFLSRREVLDYGQKAAAHCGEIRSESEKKGTPVGVDDLHIAGYARSEGLILVTNNEREFTRMSGLRVENWL